MLFFQQNINQSLEHSDRGEIVRMQTDKCYSRIPQYYFQQEMDPHTLNEFLTRDRRKAVALRDDLSDYYDEVSHAIGR
jgi:hypothetical protein